MKIFSGTSNEPLAGRIAKLLDMPLGDVEITRFIDNECRVFVREDVSGQEVFVVQSLSEVADQHLVELCLLGSAIKNLGATKVTAVIPWMGYSKQDKAFRKGEAISSQLVAKFIEAAGFDAVISVELHSENVLPFFRIPVIEISAHELLRETLFSSERNFTSENAVVVSPDKGGVSRSERFAEKAGLSTVYLMKHRDTATGEVTVDGIEGAVDGKAVIIFDDIINTGATAVTTSKFVKEKGATSVYFLATHAVLAGHSAETLSQSVIDKVIVTDTIAVPTTKHFATLDVVSVSSLLADAIMQQTK